MIMFVCKFSFFCENTSIFCVQVMAFHDVTPQAPVHFLVIPKKPIVGLSAATDCDSAVCSFLILYYLFVIDMCSYWAN
jgi:diadenosine tetraphosphate (Ap4A) HIT family hydrolase